MYDNNRTWPRQSDFHSIHIQVFSVNNHYLQVMSTAANLVNATKEINTVKEDMVWNSLHSLNSFFVFVTSF